MDQYNFLTRPFNNVSATTDPVVGSDTTQGYSVGSVWINTTNNRLWQCIVSTAGAAIWAFMGAAYSAGGAEPPNVATQFGGAALGSAMGAFYEEGNLYRNVGNPIAGNAADATDDIIGGIQLPAGTFDVAGRGISITAQGKTGATANAGKRIKLWLNPTLAGNTITNGVIAGGTASLGTGVLLLDSGATAINAKGWSLFGNLFKYGAAGSNTQYFQGSVILDTTHGGILVPVFSTQTESAAMNLVVTGASAQSGANDIVLNFLEFNAMN